MSTIQEQVDTATVTQQWAEAVVDAACSSGAPISAELLIEMSALSLRDELAKRWGHLGRTDNGAGYMDRLSTAAKHAADDLRAGDHTSRY